MLYSVGDFGIKGMRQLSKILTVKNHRNYCKGPIRKNKIPLAVLS
jgi:hypothetical protein